MEIFKRLLLTCVILPVVFTVGLSWTLVTSRPIYAGALQSRPGATVITDTTNSVLLPMDGSFPAQLERSGQWCSNHQPATYV
jgi:hypothetical protein